MKLALKQTPPGAAPSSEPDLIFIHGTGSNSHMWDKQVLFFSELGYRCFQIDLRGHGMSPEPREITSLKTHEDDLFETIAESGAKFPAIFIGHSLGAIVSITMARQKPDWFMSIFAASLPGKVIPVLPMALRMFIRGPFQLVRKAGISKHFAWRERTLFEMDKFSLDQIAINFAGINFVSEPFGAPCPVHLAAGRFDPVAPYWHVLHMHRTNPNTDLITFPWGGHNFMDADSAKFNQWLLDYIKAANPKLEPTV